jgi:hypothetical protein
MGLGYSREEAAEFISKSPLTLAAELEERVVSSVKVNGKPASIYSYPDLTSDPNIETVVGRYAHGFDLGGSDAAAKFEDPDTHQKVDNQLWRALGCVYTYRVAAPTKPFGEEVSWGLMLDTAPMWTLAISGENLDEDGDVTVTFDRALQHAERDATGAVLSNATYVIDPTKTSHNVLKGKIQNGVLSVEPKDIYLKGQLPFFFEIALRKGHVRITRGKTGTLIGYMGGYINWKNYIYMYTSRPATSVDIIGMYHAIKKKADASPDPITGENREISAAFRFEAVPAFLANVDGNLVATPSREMNP